MLSSLIKYNAVLVICVCNLRHLSFVAWWIRDPSFLCWGLFVRILSSAFIIRQCNWRWRFQFGFVWCSKTYLFGLFVWYQHSLMMSTLLIHMWSNSIAKWSHPLRAHVWTTFGWSLQCDKILQQGAHIWTTSGRSPQWDKVLQQGEHFEPHLVEVCCMTKSSNKGCNLDQIWLKSAAWQSPLTRGTIWTTFGQSPQWDKVLWQGASFFCHIWPMSAVWQVLLMTNHGHHSPATFGQSPLCDTLSNEGHFSFLCQICPTSAAQYATLISHCSFFWMPIAWVSQPTLPKRPLSPRGQIFWELPTKFWSSTTSWIIWLGASKPIPYPPSGLSIWDLYVPNSFMPPDLFQSGWQAHCLHWKLVQQNGRVQFDQDQRYVHSSFSLYQG